MRGGVSPVVVPGEGQRVVHISCRPEDCRGWRGQLGVIEHQLEEGLLRVVAGPPRTDCRGVPRYA